MVSWSRSRGEAAARLDLALRVHDQRLPRPLAVVLREPRRRPTGRRAAPPPAPPAPGGSSSASSSGPATPAGSGAAGRDQSMTPSSSVASLRIGSSPWSGRPAGVGRATGSCRGRTPAAPTRQNAASFAVCMPWNLSTLRPSLPVKPGVAQVGQHRGPGAPRRVNQTPLVMHLVEAEAQLGRPPRQGEQELGVEERLAAGEAEGLDALARGRLPGSAGPMAMSRRSVHSIGTQQCGQARLHW